MAPKIQSTVPLDLVLISLLETEAAVLFYLHTQYQPVCLSVMLPISEMLRRIDINS